ncbi:uncharacterized protein LOC144365436 isoform X4 [Ictidomys tridecemlineatus]
MTFNSLSSSATGKHRTTNKRFDLAIISQAGINKLIKQTQRPHLIRQQAAFFFIMGNTQEKIPLPIHTCDFQVLLFMPLNERVEYTRISISSN